MSEKNMFEADTLAKMPGLLAIKNADFRIIAITSALANLCGWKNPENAIGRIDYDIPSKVSESASDFLKIDKLALSSSVNKLQAMQILSYETGWKAMLTERQVVKTEDGLEKLYIQAIDVTNQHLVKGMLVLGKLDSKKVNSKNKQVNYIISYDHHAFSLTEKQELCLFFILRGKTMKEIAAVLNISTRTVEDYINILKDKLNCYSKSQLIEKAIDNGLFYHLPRSLLERIE